MYELRLPSLGSDMDSGRLLQWLVKPGDKVERGQVVAVVDTAKAAIDVECWQAGTVHRLLAPLQQTLPVGSPLALLRLPGESAEEVERQWAVAQAQPETEPAASAPQRPKISPAARRRAAELGLDANKLQPRAAGTALTLADIEAHGQAQQTTLLAQSGQSSQSSETDDRSFAMRATIAAAMSRSKREIPHYYLAETIPMAKASAWLRQRNESLPLTERLLPAVLLLKAVALALRRVPELNGYFVDGKFQPAHAAHIGVAISLRGGGLLAPALHDVQDKPVEQLMRELGDLVKRTRAGSLRSSEMSAPTITVTQLGEQGVEQVFGVIYPPQVALVGLGRIAERPWVQDDGKLAVMPLLSATLAADHRVSDGHRGALFLAELRDLLQEPQALVPPAQSSPDGSTP
ncbi:dihydrolipoamide acetyltransferase family protein [Roseateles oligotrophus]|uniref:Dihydrolipoamide acetyltransferase component of pyruvate dehydrogenase complex n=1 Tax=Roseateles oligotrophus TaxID=1769250 RepID=A0ABT2YIM5_9BURK|nr:dihydrolipoamide acetyltransferase family protein [Roseateles oligotrophus]MCV2369921.1 2-oxo acid dehydrogenase subunit E2 [Roseateles oligotrophus]